LSIEIEICIVDQVVTHVKAKLNRYYEAQGLTMKKSFFLQGIHVVSDISGCNPDSFRLNIFNRHDAMKFKS